MGVVAASLAALLVAAAAPAAGAATSGASAHCHFSGPWQYRNLSGCSYAGRRLSHIDATGAIFTGSTFTGSTMRHTVLIDAHLGSTVTGGIAGVPAFGGSTSTYQIVNGYFVGSNSSLSGADLRNANLNSTFLDQARLTGARFAGASFFSAVLNTEHFDTTQLQGVALNHAHLTAVTAPAGTDLSSSQFSHATLTRSAFPHARLVGATLTYATLDTVDLAGADFYGHASFERQKPGSAPIPTADLMQARFTGSNLAHANLIDADLVDARFSHTDLSGADLSHANATGASFVDSRLVGAAWGGATLFGATFVGADLAGADLATADLAGATFVHSDLRGAHLPPATALAGTRFVDSICPSGARSADAPGGCAAPTTASRAAVKSAPPACPTAAPSPGSSPNPDYEGCVFANVNWAHCDASGSATGATPDFSGAVFLNSDLSGCNLAFDLFTGATFINTSLAGTELSYTSFFDATIRNSSMHHADLNDATFAGATITGSDLSGDYISGWTAHPGDPVGVSFARSYLGGDDLNGVSLQGRSTTFDRSSIVSTTFIGSTITGGVGFRHATLVRAVIRRADLEGDAFTAATIYAASSLLDVRVGGSSFTAARIEDVRSSGISDSVAGRGLAPSLPVGWAIVDQHLVGPKASLNAIRLVGADLTRVDLTDASLAGAQLFGARLGGVQLTGADLAGARLGFADLSSSSLIDADLQHANLLGANLAGADLAGANLDGTILDRARFTGVTGEPFVHFHHTICPDGTNSDNDGGTCVGHTNPPPASLAQQGANRATLTPAQSAGYHAQLAMSGAAGATSYTVTTPCTALVVTATGQVRVASGELAAGDYVVAGTATDAAHALGGWAFTLEVVPGALTQRTEVSRTVATTASGAGFSAQIGVAGATGPVSFETTSTVGHLAVSTSGEVTTAGGPLAAGTYRVFGTDVDALGDTGAWTYTLVVSPAALTQQTPPSITVDPDDTGTSFRYPIAVNGAVGAPSFAVSSPDPHLAVSAQGVVSTVAGPLATGTYTVSGTVTDALGDTGTWTFTLVVVSTDPDARIATSPGAAHVVAAQGAPVLRARRAGTT